MGLVFKVSALQRSVQVDLASRGPWGAVRLLWTLRDRHWVATVGALVTVAALAIDPFAQLLIRYDNCNVQLSNTFAVIPKKNTFSEIGLHIDAGYSTLTYGLQSAINTGLFNPEAINIPHSCTTGNCTFDKNYHTVGYCSRCTDRSTDLNTACYDVNQTRSGSSTSNITFNDMQTMRWRCNTSLPGGFAAISADNTRAGYRLQITYFRIGPPASAFQNTTLMIAANLSSVYEGKCTTTAENATWSCKSFGAAACTLYPCIRSYSASTKDNKFEETLISTSDALSDMSFREQGTIGASTIDGGCLPPKDRQSLIEIGYEIEDSVDWIPYYGLGAFGNTTDTYSGPVAPNVTVPDDCLYQFYMPSLMSIDRFMNQFFNGSITAYTYEDRLTSGSVQLNKLFDSGNISFAQINIIFSNVADSMTAYMRSSAKLGYTGTPGTLGLEQDNSEPAKGQAFHSDICVYVRWWYLALPIILVTLTCTFLVAILVQAQSQHRGRGWKFSSLALLPWS